MLGLNDVLIYISKQTPQINYSLLFYYLIEFMPFIHLSNLFESNQLF